MKFKNKFPNIPRIPQNKFPTMPQIPIPLKMKKTNLCEIQQILVKKLDI